MLDHILDRNSKLFQNRTTRSGNSKAVNAHNHPIKADIFGPKVRNTRFHSQAIPATLGQDGISVVIILAVKAFHAGHGYHPDGGSKLIGRFQGNGNFTSRGEQDQFKLSFFLQPHPASGLPLLPPDCNKLAAATALRLDKVIAYVEERVPSGKPLALFASGKPLAPDMSLGAVRAFVWKSADEMVLQYKQA